MTTTGLDRCPDHPEHNFEDCPRCENFLKEHSEEILAGHEGHCVANAVSAAIDHGIDDPSAFRTVAAQFLEDHGVLCLCTAPGWPKIDYPTNR